MSAMVGKLGIRPPSPARVAAAPQAAAYIDAAEAIKAMPMPVEWSARVPNYDNHENDKFGCCGPVSLANLLKQQNYADGRAFQPSTQDVLAVYQAVGGWNGRDSGSGTDRGVDPLDLAEYAMKIGICGRKALGYVVVDHTNYDLVRVSHYWFGGLCVCVNMPKAWNGQYASRWVAPTDTRGLAQNDQWRPGGWGGHAIMSADIVPEGLRCGTWGRLQELTANGLKVYGMVVIGFLFEDWFGDDHIAPNGFNKDKLLADMEVFRKGGKLEPVQQGPKANTWRSLLTGAAALAGANVESKGNKDTLTWA